MNRYPQGDSRYPAGPSCVSVYFGFFIDDFRSRTPAPPPFSSMNSTPARFIVASIFSRVSGSPA